MINVIIFHHTQWEVFFQIKFHMKFHSFHLGMKSRVNRNFFIPGRDFISVTCKRTLKLYKFYKKASVIESLLSKTLSPHTYNCTSNDTLTNVFLWIYPCENMFSSLHFTPVCIHRYSTNICSWNFPKIHREMPVPDSLDSSGNVF